FADLAERLGAREAFTEGRDEMGWLRHLYESGESQAASLGLDVPGFGGFWEAGILEFEIPEESRRFVRYAEFRADPLFNPLGTPSGLIEIYSRTIERMGYDGCPPHATWMPPEEWSGGYPLHVNSAHPYSRLHSQLNGTVLRADYAVADREPCMIHPDDAAARGIEDGDVVRVFNHRGQTLAGAIVTDATRPGVIRLNEGGWFDPVDASAEDALCAHGDANMLTRDVPTSRLANGNSGHSCLADVEKFTGDLPPVTVFEAPAEG
ncbi:MAG: trimethylamine-N-oxide reductase TorA, partial [Rhodobacteraceae bacterium]